jgi:hypothetical protein
MDLIAPDILADVRQLSAILPIGGLLAGVVLWLAGWWTHRFWVVLTLTVLGGIVGLQYAAQLRTQPLPAALGVALVAGILGMTLIQLLAFLAGGVAGLLLVNLIAPVADQPFFAFLLGGLAGLLLFRFWMMALTSLTGVLLIAYSGLALAGKWITAGAAGWCEAHGQIVTILLLLAAVGGFVVQLGCDWLVHRKPAPVKSAPKKDKVEKKDDKKPKEEGRSSAAA